MPRLKNILVTGANGFIGSRFVALNTGNYNLKAVSLRFVSIEEVDCENIDSIVHFAGLAHQMEEVDPKMYYDINRDLTLQLAQKAKDRGTKQFIYISSTKVYGDGANGKVFSEDSACHPTDPYGDSKLQAENGLKELENDHFKVAIIRPPLVYGPGVKGNLLLFLKLAKTSIPLPFKSVNNNRAMVFVDNLVALIDRIIDTEARGVFTLTDVDQISTELLMKEMRKNFDKKPMLFYAPAFIKLPIKWLKPAMYSRLFGSFNIDCTHTLKSLDYQNPVSFKQGIKSMVDHYKLSKT